MSVITRILLMGLTCQQVCGRATVPIVKYNGCIHERNGSFRLNCTTSNKIYVLHAILSRSADKCQDESRCCASTSDCTTQITADHLEVLKNRCNGHEECQVDTVKQLCNGQWTDYETVTLVCTAALVTNTAVSVGTTAEALTVKATTTTIVSTATTTIEAPTVKATTTTIVSTATTTTEAPTVKATTTTTATASTATTTAAHVVTTAQNDASIASSSTATPANTDIVWSSITTRSLIDSTTNVATGGSTSADGSLRTNTPLNDASGQSNTFTTTTMTVLIAVSCVVTLAALTLFIIYMTTRRTSQQQPLVKTVRSTSIYDAIPID